MYADLGLFARNTGNTNLIYSSNLWILIDINLGLYRYKNCRGIKDNWIL